MSGNGGLNSINVTIKPKNYQVNQNTNLKKLNNIDLNVAQNEYTINENFFNNYSDLEVPTLEELKEATKNYSDAISTAQQKQILKADEAINNYLYEHPLAKDIANLTQAASYGILNTIGEVSESVADAMGINGYDNHIHELYSENVVSDGYKSVTNIANRVDDFLDEHPLAKDIANLTQAASYVFFRGADAVLDNMMFSQNIQRQGELMVMGEESLAKDINNVTNEAIKTDWVSGLYDENVLSEGNKSISNMANRVDDFLDEHPLAKDISNIAQVASYGTLKSIDNVVNAATENSLIFGKASEFLNTGAEKLGLEILNEEIETLYDENVISEGNRSISNMANRVDDFLDDHPMAKDISNIYQATSYGILNTYGEFTEAVSDAIGVNGYDNHIHELYDENVGSDGVQGMKNMASRVANGTVDLVEGAVSELKDMLSE